MAFVLPTVGRTAACASRVGARTAAAGARPALSVQAQAQHRPFSGVTAPLATGRSKLFEDKSPAYLDYQATTPVDPRVLDAMLPYLSGRYGNPHSRSHAYGWDADKASERARESIQKFIGANRSSEIIFTSGATESNNLALKGVAGYLQGANSTALESGTLRPVPNFADTASLAGTEFEGWDGDVRSIDPKLRKRIVKNHIITTEVEHKCVLSSCRELEAQLGVFKTNVDWGKASDAAVAAGRKPVTKADFPSSWEVTYLPVDDRGVVDLELLKKSIRPSTAVVSCMYVNNEIGTMQPIKEMGDICRARDVLFHTDAAQALGKVPLDVDDMKIDLMSLSGHKIYAPKGIGALYVRKRNPRVRIRPIIDGGGQEFGIRSGTLPAHLCVGLGAAVDVARKEMQNDERHVRRLADRLHARVTRDLEAVGINGPDNTDDLPDGKLGKRYPGNLNLSFACVEGESLLMKLSKHMSVSSGSACTSASLEPSYVLRALGVTEDLAHTSLRFGIGRFTTEAEVDEAGDAIVEAVTYLREMSPLWDIYLEGDGGEKITYS